LVVSLVGIYSTKINCGQNLQTLNNLSYLFKLNFIIFLKISLTAILLHFSLEWLQIESDIVIFYEVWVQDVLINSFLVAGLYCAVLLTIER